MGYFCNGTDGALYEGKYCDHCQHQDPDGDGCAIWLAHLLHAYSECGKKSAGEEILNLLIPRDEKGFNAKCKMHLPIAEEDE